MGIVERRIKKDGDELADKLVAMDAERKINANDAGKRLGFTIPQRQFRTCTHGKSRYKRLICDSLVRNLRSWNARREAYWGDEDDNRRYVSSGWVRTLNDSPPCDLEPQYSLSAVDSQFATIVNNPFQDGVIDLKMVIRGDWYILRFPFDKDRFCDADRITLPDVVVHNGVPQFNFTAAYPYTYTRFSERYVVGVDVGIANTATVVVWDSENECIVHSSTLSRRAHSLANSICATNRQVKHLRMKKKYGEAACHRRKNSRKKRELAIIVGQEIADIAYIWDNALIVCEDLGFISNTMSNGRWNRGAVVEWITHFHQLNGGRVLTVNPAYTSQRCHQCGQKVDLTDYHTAICPEHGACDRDVNAAANIAQKDMTAGTVKKCVDTRKKAKKCTTKKIRRTPTSRDSLTYPGRDRTKNKPTPKRTRTRQAWKKKNIVTRLIFSEEVTSKNMCSPTYNDDRCVIGDGGRDSRSNGFYSMQDSQKAAQSFHYDKLQL